jgi:hypothetical protein
MTLFTVIYGCDSGVAIEKFANMKRNWFEQYLSLEYGIPSHDTFGRVFSLIDPEPFQVCFSNWIKVIVKNVTGVKIIKLISSQKYINKNSSLNVFMFQDK